MPKKSVYKNVTNEDLALMIREGFDDLAFMVKQGFDDTPTKGEMNERFERVDERFEQVDKRFEQVDKRFDSLEFRVSHLEIDREVIKKVKSALAIE